MSRPLLVQEDVQQHPPQWESAIQLAIVPVSTQLATLEDKQANLAAAMGKLEEELSGVSGKGLEMAATISTLQVGQATNLLFSAEGICAFSGLRGFFWLNYKQVMVRQPNLPSVLHRELAQAWQVA